MKRLLSLILCAVMVLGLCACGASAGEGGAAAETTAAAATGGSFRVGYGKQDITPEGQVAMGGYGRSNLRLSKGVLSYLYATCIAITDADDNTLLIYGLDLMGVGTALNFRKDISEATGVPVDNIVMSASHTHSAPDYDEKTAGNTAALEKLKLGLVKSAQIAMDDRKEAKMYGGSIQAVGMNFVRHYVMNDGTYCGDNFGSKASGYARHATDADAQLQLIKFVREGDNDIYLTNFQCHPHQTGGSKKYDISADVVGEYRAAMENQLGCEVLYLSGASGNINSRSHIKEEMITSDWKEWGLKLAEYAQQVEFTELATGKVQAAYSDFRADINHADDGIANICKNLRNQWDKDEITETQLIEIAWSQYGIKLNSASQAGAIANRAEMPASKEFTISAFSFGDVGLAAFPGEQFDTNGKFIKDNSPFAMTIVATKGNGENGYFPSEIAFGYGSYEVDTTKFVCGTAERLADRFVEMLEEQYNNK